MHRFLLNRMWTFALALLIGLAGLSVSSTSTFAASGGGGVQGGDLGDPLDPIVTPPDPVGTGDPDSPSTGGRSTARQGAGGGNARVYGTQRVGDATVTGREMVLMQVRIAMRLFKAYYLKF